MSTIFPSANILALTATATITRKKEICQSLGLTNAEVNKVNPDRRNIFFSVFPRPNHGDNKLYDILYPIVLELLDKNVMEPKTLLYGTMEIISECYIFFSQHLGRQQYFQIGASQYAKNRLFTQYHAQYPAHEQERILKEVVKPSSVIRCLFVAFGLGIDCPDICRVIHIGPPRTMEEYFQEAERAGRDGRPAVATVYYNSYDISRAKKNMQEIMQTFVTSDVCPRKMILEYFSFTNSALIFPSHLCCDVHKAQCTCRDCVDQDCDAVEKIENLKISSSTPDTESNVDLPMHYVRNY